MNTANMRAFFNSYLMAQRQNAYSQNNANDPNHSISYSNIFFNIFVAIQSFALGFFIQFFLSTKYNPLYSSVPQFIFGGYNLIAFITQLLGKGRKQPNFNWIFIYVLDVNLAGLGAITIYILAKGVDNFLVTDFLKELQHGLIGTKIPDVWISLIISIEVKIIFFIQQLFFYKFHLGYLIKKLLYNLFVSLFGVAILGCAFSIMVNDPQQWIPTEVNKPFSTISMIERLITGTLVLATMVNENSLLLKWINSFTGIALIGNIVLTSIYILDLYIPGIPPILTPLMFDQRDAEYIFWITLGVVFINLIIFIASVIGYPQPPRPKYIIPDLPDHANPMYVSAV